MPKRTEDTYGEHHGKHKYISRNYQRNWNMTDDSLEVKTDVEIDTGEKVIVDTEVKIQKSDLPKEVKEKRRKLIKKHHHDKNPNDPKSSDKLKKILKDFGDD